MKDEKLINGNFEIGDTAYYIMDCRIIKKEVFGVLAEEVKERGIIKQKISYQIEITLNNGWVRPEELFTTKAEAGKHLLTKGGLEVSLSEIR